MKKKTLLLLTCGTNACYHIAKILKEKYTGQIRIVGTDINKQWMIPTSQYLDMFYQCPYTNNPNYYTFILNICKAESVDFILPSFDEDQNLFYVENPDLKMLNVKSFGISKEIKDIYSSKETVYKYLNSIGIPTPHNYSLSEITPEKEYFIKPINGVGSIGVKRIHGTDISKFQDSCILIQELCHGPEITLECFLYNGALKSIARVRLYSKAGVCVKTKIYNDTYLSQIAEKFATATKLPHIFNLQFMKNSNEEFVITDVNLRTAGGMSLSYATGWDEASALAEIMLGRGEDAIMKHLTHPTHEQYVVRAYADIITKIIKHRIAFDLDGTLLDSRLRHSIVMNEILNSYNIKIDSSDLIQFKSNGYNNIAWLKNKGLDDETAKKINNEWISKIELPQYLKYDILYSHTLDILATLSKENSLYLVTARSKESYVREQLDSLRITQYFDEIYVVPSCKQSAELKSNFLKDNQIEYFIGDTEVDQVAANSSNCEFRVCYDGFRSKEYWSNKNIIEFHIDEFK